MRASSSARTPVSTITGFLGAGKTTLINYVLGHAVDTRYVVFVNDFGAINIDADLISSVAADRITLSNGCVCCTLNQEMASAILGHVRSADRPDAILLEASGVSNPQAIFSTLDVLEQSGDVRQDARIHMLDASMFELLPFEDAELQFDHAAVSDIVIVNKVDLASKSARASLVSELEQAAPFSHIVESERGAIELSLLTGVAPNPLAHRRKKLNSPAHISGHHYRSWSFRGVACFSRKRFESLVKELPMYCIRAKGLVRFIDVPLQLYAFNLVGYRADLELLPRSTSDAVSKLVFIGRTENFDERRVRELVQAAEIAEREEFAS